MTSLDRVELEKECFVVSIENDLAIKRRFLDIGIVPGVLIKKVLNSPFGGISAYYVMGSTIAIRDEDARGIQVKYENL